MARYLDTLSGRWISRDPIGLRGGDWNNLYRYVINNPVMNSDPSGLSRSCTKGGWNEDACKGICKAGKTSMKSCKECAHKKCLWMICGHCLWWGTVWSLCDCQCNLWSPTDCNGRDIFDNICNKGAAFWGDSPVHTCDLECERCCRAKGGASVDGCTAACQGECQEKQSEGGCPLPNP